MMKTLALKTGILMVILCGLWACESQNVNLDNEISLKDKEEKTFNSDEGLLKIKINEILDSRCPEDVVCVRAGEVIVDFDLDFEPTTGDKISLKHQQLCIGCDGNMPIEGKVKIGEMTLALNEVSPIPNTKNVEVIPTAVFSFF